MEKSQSDWELLGKPKLHELEALIATAQAEYREAKDPISKSAHQTRLERLLQIEQYLDEEEARREALACLSRAGAELALVKKSLTDSERVVMHRNPRTASVTTRYEVMKSTGALAATVGEQEVAPDGTVRVDSPSNTLAIMRASQLSMDNLTALAHNVPGSVPAIRKIAKEVVRRQERLKSLQDAVVAISRALSDGCSLIITKGHGVLEPYLKPSINEYKARLRLILAGRVTEVREGKHYVDGHEVVAFSLIKSE